MTRLVCFLPLTLLACGGSGEAGRADGAQGVGQCPTSIAVDQRFTGRAGPWHVASDSGAPQLAGVTFYDGPPQERASLVNDTATESPDTWTGIWRFSQDSGRGHWVACAYTRTNLVLSARLPEGTSRCHVTYAKNVSWPGGGQVVKEMNCSGGL